jgi:hypothetical protein
VGAGDLTVSEDLVVTGLDPFASLFDDRVFEGGGYIAPEAMLELLDATAGEPARDGEGRSVVKLRGIWDHLREGDGGLPLDDLRFLVDQIRDDGGKLRVIAGIILSRVRDDRHVDAILNLARSGVGPDQDAMTLPLAAMAERGSPAAWNGLRAIALEGNEVAKIAVANAMRNLRLGSTGDGKSLLDAMAVDSSPEVAQAALAAAAPGAEPLAGDRWVSEALAREIDLERMAFGDELASAERDGDQEAVEALVALRGELEGRLSDLSHKAMVPPRAVPAEPAAPDAPLPIAETPGLDYLRGRLVGHLSEQDLAALDPAERMKVSLRVADYYLLLREGGVPQATIETWVAEGAKAQADPGPAEGAPSATNPPEPLPAPATAPEPQVPAVPSVPVSLSARLSDLEAARDRALLDGDHGRAARIERRIEACLEAAVPAGPGPEAGPEPAPSVGPWGSIASAVQAALANPHQESLVEKALDAILAVPGPQAVEGMLWLIHAGGDELRSATLAAVSQSWRVDMAPVIGALLVVPGLERQAAKALATLSENKEAIGPALLKLALAAAGSGDTVVRGFAVGAFLHQPGDVATAALRELVTDRNPEVRLAATKALAARHAAQGVSVDHAAQMLHAEASIDHKRVWLEHLANHPHASALHHLVRLTESNRKDVVLMAMTALAGRKEPKARVRLREIAKNAHDAEVRRAASRLGGVSLWAMRARLLEGLRSMRKRTGDVLETMLGGLLPAARRR